MDHAFEHACRSCGKPFSPLVDLESYTILTARCPHCDHNHGYDNRTGQLRSLIAARLGRQPLAAGETKPEPEHPSQPEPAAQHTGAVTVFEESATEYEQAGSYANFTTSSPYTYHEVAENTATHEQALPSAFRLRLPSARFAVLVAGVVFTVGFSALLVMQSIPVSAAEAQNGLAQLRARQADLVLDRNGREINRLGVAGTEKANLTDFHKWQLDALLYSEDREFYSHSGVSYPAIARAAVNNLLRFRYAQGASTITQQLARIILQNRQKSIFRKLHEIRLARALEAILPKQKILELYVNHVYLGHGNYSFASAARFYYDKTVQQLNANEFLSLVALIPSPERYSPLRNNRVLQNRMQVLYRGIQEAGILSLSAAAWQQGMSGVTAQAGRFATETAFGEKSRTGLWPAQYARDFLMQRRILSGENQNSARVYTTIDLELQQRAEELVVSHLRVARKNFRGVIKSADERELKLKNRLRGAVRDYGLLLDLGGLPLSADPQAELQAALIALNPRTGEILAMVGGESFESKNQLNRTVQMRRQTGSAIKPFIYSKALSQHLIHPVTLIDDTPYVAGSGAKTWAPENINGGFEGPMPARDALAKSRNIPAIRVGRLLGRESVTELFSEFFFQSEAALAERFSYDETVAIGTISMSPLELARGFSVFANGGFLNDPLLVTRVETAEKLVDLRKTHTDQMGLSLASREKLLSAAETQLMVSMLKSSGRNAGTGVKDIIGKTGTSSESRDLWFVGGGKEMVVAVWFGYDDMRFSLPGATGSALAARLAGDFLKRGFAPVEFKMQPGMVRLRVCPLSGRLAAESCSHARSEVFLSGVTPEGECLHGVENEQADFMAVMGESQFR